jgi:hypothetical protein
MNAETKIYYDNATNAQRVYIEKHIQQEMAACQTALVEELLKREIFSWDDVENLYPTICPNCNTELPLEQDDCKICGHDKFSQPQEIFQWFLINEEFLIEDLIKAGKPVLKNEFGSWWGRTCFGQAVVLDSTFWNIYQDELKRVKEETTNG